MRINFKLNGQRYNMDVPENMLLIDFLRKKMGLTGTKLSCGEGECGSCTVIVNNKPVLSCLMMAVQIDKKEIITIEGIKDKKLFEAYLKAGATQCGFCTPGFVVYTYWMKKNKIKGNLKTIKYELSGNICRCTGYTRIIKAVKNYLDKSS
ncbi:MAG: (2Fe-2S)-binding protein [bacterium]|nr:(2Fe-2S)-binding protein [bacterium]